MKIVVAGVELTVTQDGNAVTVRRLSGRDRLRDLDITNAVTFGLGDSVDPVAIQLVRALKHVAGWKTAGCTCNYGPGWSDHAMHCLSIDVAKNPGGHDADDD